MKVEFKVPVKVKDFAKEEGIKLDHLKKRIDFYLDTDLVDDNYEPVKCNLVEVVVNGIQKMQGKKILIIPSKVSKKKPFRSVSSNLLLRNYSVNYLIYKKNKK
jgi:hypothetical protein